MEPQATPNTVEIFFAHATFDEHGSHDTLSKRPRVFTAECQRIFAAEVTVADISIPIVSQIVFQIDLIEEAGSDIIPLSKGIRSDNAWRSKDGRRLRRLRYRRLRCVIPELYADDALKRPAPLMSFFLSCAK